MKRTVKIYFAIIITLLSISIPENLIAQSDSSLQIIFSSSRSGFTQIYAMDSNGDNIHPLTSYEEFGQYNGVPSYSADANRIAFVSQPDRNLSPQIITMTLDGLDRVNLTDDDSTKGYVDWSPNGNQIVFSSNINGERDIYLLNSDGSGLTRLTTDAGSNTAPRWSPTGTYIAFQSTRDVSTSNPNQFSEIYVMNTNGSNQTRLTFNAGNDGWPAWSPDGSKLVFASQRGGENYDIYKMNADGSSVVQLTQNVGNNYEPVWSPDGTMIAFSSDRDGNFEIYVMNADGTNPQRLTNDANNDGSPSWRVVPLADLEGQITLQAQVSGSNNYALPPTVKLVDPVSLTVVSTYEPTTDTTGEFVIEDIPQGTYEIWVKHDKGLAVMSEVELNAATVPFDFGTILMGDANNDNMVGLTDFSILSASYGKSMGQAGYDARADFNGSNSVTLADYSIVSSNYDAVGVPDPEPSGARIAPLSSGTVDLALTPDINTIAVGQEFDVTVSVKAGEQLVDGAAAVLTFDPALLEEVSVTAGTSLPVGLRNTVDNTAGQVSYAAGALEAIPSGTFDLVTVRFRALAVMASTGISFVTDGTTGVTYAGESVLNATEPAGVTIME